MKIFRVYVEYTTTAYTEVEAEDESEALAKVDAGDYPDLYGEDISSGPRAQRAEYIDEADEYYDDEDEIAGTYGDDD